MPSCARRPATRIAMCAYAPQEMMARSPPARRSAARPLARQRGADADAEHGALGERRIDHAVAELLQERAQQQKCVAVAAADVLAVHEHPRIAAKRVADAEHHGLEEGPAFRVERW